MNDVDRLSDQAVVVRSVAPADEDFTDLAALRSALEHARIVMLGEQTHGDGTTFEAKVRLIKFLHQELGFSVIAFESGIYECANAWERIASGSDPTPVVRGAVFPIWSECAQVRELWRYLGEHARSSSPLELAGFDCQLTGDLVRSMPDEFPEHRRAAQILLSASIKKPDRTSPTRDALRSALEELRAAATDPWRRQLVRSLRGNLESTWLEQDATWFRRYSAASNNPRDKQMADNLCWLANERYRGRKIVVWAATTHLICNADTLEERILGFRRRPFTKMIPMGHHVDAQLGDDIYTIGFIAGGGRWKWAHRGGLPFRASGSIDPPPEHSFDGLFARANIEYGFLDLGRDAAWFAPRISQAIGYAPMSAAWPRVLDGLFFTKTMRGADPM